MGDADLIFATASGSKLIEWATPGTTVQDKLLEIAKQNSDFKELRQFPTPGGANFYLFDRKVTRKVVKAAAPIVAKSGPPGPSLVSLEPRKGTGKTMTMTVRVKPRGKVQNLKGVMVLMSGPEDPRTCSFLYIPAAGGIMMQSETGFLPIMPVGSGSQSTRYCSIRGAASNAWIDGADRVLRFTLDFTNAFDGWHSVLVYADGNDSGATNWTRMGEWIVTH